MKWFWRGLGIGVGLACWPLLIPMLLLFLLAAMAKRAAPAQAPQPAPPVIPETPSMLRELRAVELAKVERRNREHLERCFTQEQELF